MIATVTGPVAEGAAVTAPSPRDAVRDGTARSSAAVAGASPGSVDISKSVSVARAVEAAAVARKAAAVDAVETADGTEGLSFGQ